MEPPFSNFPHTPPQSSGYIIPAVQSIPIPQKTKQRRTRPIEIALLAISLALLLFSTVFLAALVGIGGSVSALLKPSGRNVSPPTNSFSVVRIVGTIQNSSGDGLGINEPSYNHGETVRYIKSLAESPNDKGILLYMDTGGGGIYESDEVYRALLQYKETTQRPVWVYMASSCASGGYYISMAADHLIANYNTTTGSIGVYIALTDTSQLYDMVGIKTVLVRSGDNKGVGTNGIEITPDQEAVYQSIVDEHYQRFVSLVALGRSVSEKEVTPLADGRPFTGQQALENGLVDELNDWDTALTLFQEKTGAKEFYPSFSQQSLLGSILGETNSMLPKGEAETILALVEELPSGVPMAYAPGLWPAANE